MVRLADVVKLSDDDLAALLPGRVATDGLATLRAWNPDALVLFTTGALDAGYVRFVERKLREEFAFTGTPIHITVKPRKKQGRR